MDQNLINFVAYYQYMQIWKKVKMFVPKFIYSSKSNFRSSQFLMPNAAYSALVML